MGCSHGWVDPENCADCRRQMDAVALASALREQLAVGDELVGELRECAADIKALVDATKLRLEAQRQVETGAPASIYEYLDTTGRPVLAPLLAAQAEVLAALSRIVDEP